MEPGERLAVVLRRWPVVVAAVLVGLALAAAAAVLTPPTYQAQTRLFVSAGADGTRPDGRPTLGTSLAGSRLRSYPGLASSPDVLGPVARRLGLTDATDELAGRVQAVVPPGTQLIDIRVDDGSASGAAVLANAVGDRLGRAIERLETPDGGTVPLVRARTVTPATPPPAPLWPSTTVVLATGLVAGLLVGACAALTIERRRTAPVGERVAGGAPR